LGGGNLGNPVVPPLEVGRLHSSRQQSARGLRYCEVCEKLRPGKSLECPWESRHSAIYLGRLRELAGQTASGPSVVDTLPRGTRLRGTTGSMTGGVDATEHIERPCRRTVGGPPLPSSVLSLSDLDSEEGKVQTVGKIHQRRRRQVFRTLPPYEFGAQKPDRTCRELLGGKGGNNFKRRAGRKSRGGS